MVAQERIGRLERRVREAMAAPAADTRIDKSRHTRLRELPPLLDLSGFGFVLFGEREELLSSMRDPRAAGEIPCPPG